MREVTDFERAGAFDREMATAAANVVFTAAVPGFRLRALRASSLSGFGSVTSNTFGTSIRQRAAFIGPLNLVLLINTPEVRTSDKSRSWKDDN